MIVIMTGYYDIVLHTMPDKWAIGPVALVDSHWMGVFLWILHQPMRTSGIMVRMHPTGLHFYLDISQNVSPTLKSLPTKSLILFGNFPKGSPIPDRHWPKGLQQVVSTFPSVSPLK